MTRLALIVIAWSIAASACAQPQSLPIEKIKLPEGFAIEVVARVENARGMALGDKGTLFVGSMRAGKVYALSLHKARPRRYPLWHRGCSCRPASPFATARCMSPRSTASCVTTTSNQARQSAGARSSSATVSERDAPWLEIHRLRPRRQALRAGGRAMQHVRAGSGRYGMIMRMNRRWIRAMKYTRAASATASASTGIRAPASCGSPTTAATCWATIFRRTNSTTRPRPAMHFGFPYCHAGRHRRPGIRRAGTRARIRAAGAEARDRMWRRSACASTPARNFPRNTATRSSSPSTAPGTAQQDRLPSQVRADRERQGGRYEAFATGWLQGERRGAARPTC